MLRHALAGVSHGAKAMRIMLSSSLPHSSILDVTASCRRPAVPSMHGMLSCDLPWRQHGMQAVAASISRALPAVRPMSTSTRKLVVQAATGKPVSAAVAARAAVDPNSLRVVDTELHVEAERSYLAVRVQRYLVLKHSTVIPAVGRDTALYDVLRQPQLLTSFCVMSCSMPCQSSWGALCQTYGTD